MSAAAVSRLHVVLQRQLIHIGTSHHSTIESQSAFQGGLDPLDSTPGISSGCCSSVLEANGVDKDFFPSSHHCVSVLVFVFICFVIGTPPVLHIKCVQFSIEVLQQPKLSLRSVFEGHVL